MKFSYWERCVKDEFFLLSCIMIWNLDIKCIQNSRHRLVRQTKNAMLCEVCFCCFPLLLFDFSFHPPTRSITIPKKISRMLQSTNYRKMWTQNNRIPIKKHEGPCIRRMSRFRIHTDIYPLKFNHSTNVRENWVSYFHRNYHLCNSFDRKEIVCLKRRK